MVSAARPWRQYKGQREGFDRSPEVMKAGRRISNDNKKLKPRAWLKSYSAPLEHGDKNRFGEGQHQTPPHFFLQLAHLVEVLPYLFSKPVKKSHCCIKGLGQSGYHGFAGGRPAVEHAQQLGRIDAQFAASLWTSVSWVTHRVPMCWEKARPARSFRVRPPRKRLTNFW
jgi:hypothetical protein